MLVAYTCTNITPSQGFLKDCTQDFQLSFAVLHKFKNGYFQKYIPMDAFETI